MKNWNYFPFYIDNYYILAIVECDNWSIKFIYAIINNNKYGV